MIVPPTPRADTELDRGFDALSQGRYEEARHSFQEALAGNASAEALDGLGQAVWWLKDVEAGIDLRVRAYAAYRKNRQDDRAARLAVWIAREKAALHEGNTITDGWIARAARAAQRVPGTSAVGWVRLAQGERCGDRDTAVGALTAALDIAREADDPDLEICVLARLGVLHVSGGDVERGIQCLSEAMASATAGEAGDQRSLAEAYCALTDAAELLGGDDRLTGWGSELLKSQRIADLGPLAGVGSASPQATLSAFCGSCCGGVFLVSGRLDEAEEELQAALAQLRRSGLRSRCVHPGAQLADLRITQGRVAEAGDLLSEIEDLPEAVRPLAAVDLLHGDADAAAARIRRAISELQDSDLLALPLLALLVDVHLAREDLASASEAADAVARGAAISGSDRHRGEALMCAGKVGIATGAYEAAAAQLRDAATRFSQAGMPLRASQSRLQLARALRLSDPAMAITEARSARASFERLGARGDSDAATELLRHLGVRAGPGPRSAGALSAREREVLQLIAEGLSNPEIADRLFISRRTAGHHVSAILTKLGMRSRTEAAAFAAVHPIPGPDQEGG